MTPVAAEGRIGPNAIIRTIEALRARVGEPGTVALLRAAGLERYERELPHEMVAETEVTSLFATMYRELGDFSARALARDSGVRTADYLLAHRVPRPAQTVLKLLPAPLASRGLLASIRGHTWTFAGTSTVEICDGRPAIVSFAGCPLCRGISAASTVCDYYAGTFERLYRVLVHPEARATESACQAAGAARCEIRIRY